MTGKNHDRTSLALTPVAAYGLAQLFQGQLLLIAIAGYTLGWLLFSPDLDLPRSNPKRRWGMLGFIWQPYSVTHRHRGLSHWPLFGSAERLAYLLAPIGAIAWAAQPELLAYWPVLVPLWVGVELACLWHLCCDYAWPLKTL